MHPSSCDSVTTPISIPFQALSGPHTVNILTAVLNSVLKRPFAKGSDGFEVLAAASKTGQRAKSQWRPGHGFSRVLRLPSDKQYK
jgi:hypothetical protein